MTDAKSLNFQTHLSLATTFSLCAETLDLYPQVRALVLEAEAASTNIRLFRDHGDPHTWAGNILEHAGYLEDAERAYAESPRPSSDLPYIWRGWVVYGHPERAEKLIESVTSAEKKATFLASFADLLWRMGQPEQARARYDVARTIALRILDPARRKPVLATIDQGLQFVSDPPPNLISATPQDPGSTFRTLLFHLSPSRRMDSRMAARRKPPLVQASTVN